MTVKEPLTVSEAAEKLGITEAAMRERLRRGLPGAIRRSNGTWAIPTDVLEQAAQGRRRGPSRPVVLDANAILQLVEGAKAAAARIEDARAAVATAAAQRQDAILALSLGGLSVRQIAEKLEVSHAVVQAAIKEARNRATGSG